MLAAWCFRARRVHGRHERGWEAEKSLPGGLEGGDVLLNLWVLLKPDLCC